MDWATVNKQILALPIMALLLAGCDFEEEINSGNTKGFAICKKKAEEQGSVSKLTIQNVCAEKHQRNLSVDFLDGRAGFSKSYEQNVFSGSVENKSSDVVITAYTVSITHKKVGTVTRDVKGVWIEPGKSEYFNVNDLPYAKEPDLPTEHENFTWNTLNNKGIKVQF